MNLEELSQWSGESAERLLEWRSLGLIGGGRDDLGPEDVERARLIGFLLRRGIRLEAIAKADREQDVLASYVRTAFTPGSGRTYSVEEAVGIVGLDSATVRRLWQPLSFSGQGERLYEEDVQALKALKVLLEAGFPEEALLQLTRVYADALGRVAEAEIRLFHFYVHERLKAGGVSGRELVEATNTSGDRMRPLIEPVLLYFHQKGMEQAAREDIVLHVQEEAGFEGTAEVPAQLRAAVLFVDLSSFTPLTEAMGDAAAAEVLARFSQLVREAVSRCDGRVVKQIGDAFMLMFSDPRAAVACALDIERRSAEEPHFPAVRSGGHHGPVLYREGDYLGVTVNVAARLAAEAGRHQVLVSEALRREAAGVPDVEFVPLGRRRLKGVADEIELFEVVRRTEAGAGRRQVDPVCGMELGLEEPAARLAFGGREQVFCSQGCLQRFVATPDRYGPR
ncbi:MAG: YHS domain-containing protein [Deltaproteobacteria bacterium]|nr:MAG: YHS domain-containing protein [Deltaproteobacteria bacterium]